jgi:hypothetical protein
MSTKLPNTLRLGKCYRIYKGDRYADVKYVNYDNNSKSYIFKYLKDSDRPFRVHPSYPEGFPLYESMFNKYKIEELDMNSDNELKNEIEKIRKARLSENDFKYSKKIEKILKEVKGNKVYEEQMLNILKSLVTKYEKFVEKLITSEKNEK